MKRACVFAISLVLCSGNALEQQVDTSLPAFDVASVKQNRSLITPQRLAFTNDGVTIQNVLLINIIRAAYGRFNSVDASFIGMPEWAKDESYDIEAKVAGADSGRFQKLNFDERQRMVQLLLADRFRLKAHVEIRQQPAYVLVVASRGSKLVPETPAEDADPGGSMKREPGRITAKDLVLPRLATSLTAVLGRVVLDETNLSGKYNFALTWVPDEGTGGSAQAEGGSLGQPVASGASLFKAIEEQLGLKLVGAKRPIECLVIDYLERPSEN